MDDPSTKHKVLILASVVDSALAGIVRLIYFGFLPVDISGWGISRGVIGLVGGVWLLGALGILVYFLTKTDIPE